MTDYVQFGVYECHRCGKTYTVNDEWATCTPELCHGCTITADKFKDATGNTPQDDDLDRCNCALEGRDGHWHCGWNVTYNLPNHYLPMDKIEEDRRKRGVPSFMSRVQ